MADQLELFYDLLPETVRVLPAKGAGSFLRRKPKAIEYPWLAPNHGNISCLVVDVDRRVTPYEIYDAHLPEPNLAALNRETGHCQYFWQLSAPVHAWNTQRDSAAYRYYEAIEAGFTDKLGGDPSFAACITKNPLHSMWDTHELYGDTYELGELAEWVDLSRKRKKASQIITEDVSGRNQYLFDELRKWAYKHYREARKHPYPVWLEQCLTRAMALNGFEQPLGRSEVACIARSVAKFVYTRYKPQWHRGRDAEMIDSEMSIQERQRLAAQRTNAARKGSTEGKIAWAVAQLKEQEKRISKAAVARLAGVNRKTIERRYTHLLETQK